MLCTDRRTDNAVHRQTDRRTALYIDGVTDGWMLYMCTDRKADLLMMYRRTDIHQTMLSNTECMTDNVLSLQKETHTS